MAIVNSNNLAHKLLIAYQLLFAFAVACVSFFTVSTSYANERYVEGRIAVMTERMMEAQAMRSLEMAQQLQEARMSRYTENQIENTIAQSAEQVIEDRIASQQIERLSNAESLQNMSGEDRVFNVNRQISGLRQQQNQIVEQQAARVMGREDYYGKWDPEPDPDPNLIDDNPVDNIPEEELSDEDLLGSFDPSENDDIADKSNDQVEEEAAQEAEEQVNDAIESNVDDAVSQNSLDTDALFDVNDLQFEQALTTVQSDARILDNIDEKNVWTNQWVIMADAEAKEVLEREGYQFSNEEKLEAFDSIIANVKAPASFDLFEDYQLVMDKLGNHDAVIDLNHVYTNIYTNATQSKDDDYEGLVPGDIMSIDGKGVRIGMVDTAINTRHKYLQNARIVQKHFTQDNLDPVYEHGTAVASVFSGESGAYQGIIKDAELFNASVFVEADQSQSITTALSLMKGLNWLVQQDIKVINMSLAGPPNRLLQKGIKQLCQQGIIVVAAAGNNGPFAKPMYPAGYGCALAVTAVDAQNKLYKKAVRGDHIDIAAYGVDIMAASDNDGLSAQSGTSIAAPFVSAWIAAQLPNQGSANNWLDLALENCIDLGEKGIDPLYGKGLLPFDTVQLAKLDQFNHLQMIMHR